MQGGGSLSHHCFMLAGLGKAILFMYSCSKIILENICTNITLCGQDFNISLLAQSVELLLHTKAIASSNPTLIQLFHYFLNRRGIGFCCLLAPLVNTKIWLLLPAWWRAWRPTWLMLPARGGKDNALGNGF